MDVLAPANGQAVLDVGCGAGETILQLADRVGEAGHVVGVDVAPRVLEVARSSVSSGDADEMLKVVTRVRALGMILRAVPSLLPQVEPKVRAALITREEDGKVSLRAATWIVTADAM